MVKHLGREVKLAEDVRTAQAGVPVACDMCTRELIVAEAPDTPVVCETCWELLTGKSRAADQGFDLGI